MRVLFDKFRTTLKDRDTDSFLALMCPGVRSSLDPEEWFRAPVEEMGAMSSIEMFRPPDGGKDAPDATEWRRLHFEPGGRLRVAKIGGTWFACET